MNMLENWWIIILILYFSENVVFVVARIYGGLQGYGYAETPSEKAELFNINLFGGIIIFILGIIICPLWHLLFWTYKLIYFLFHIGLKD